MVVSMPGFRTRTLDIRWVRGSGFGVRGSRSGFLVALIVFVARDRVELHGIPRLHEERLRAVGIERLERGAANHLPTARRLGWVDPGLYTCDAHRSNWNAHTRRRMARHRNPGIDDAQIRESGDEAD